jgi:putative ABC transport system permease protein
MRTKEIGIRLAVGAQGGEIFRLVAGEGLRLSLTGLSIGMVASLAFARVGSTLLFGVSAADPLTLLSVSLLLLMVAMLACYFPARRAMKVEPLVALRQD